MKQEISQALLSIGAINNTYTRAMVARYMLEGVDLKEAAILTKIESELMKRKINEESEK